MIGLKALASSKRHNNRKKTAFSDRGKPVPLLVSEDEFAQQQTKSQGFCEAYQKFRQKIGLHRVGITPSTFRGLRDRTPARQVKL